MDIIVLWGLTKKKKKDEIRLDTSLERHFFPFLFLLGENQQISDRSSPINGPGLAKPIAMTSSTTSSKDSSSPSSQHRLPPSTNPTVGKKRVDAALEKNIETIVTQVRRTTTKPSQLTQNDLQLFDSTVPTAVVKNGHHSRETTPSNSHTLQKQSSSSSREMTPDSINTDSANEDQQQTIRNGHSHHPYPVHAHHPSHPHHPHHAHQQRSARLPTSTVDLSSVPSLSPYGPQGWPPTVYPFAPQHHPGLYLPYPPSATTSSPTNGLPAFYPPYDPLLIEQHYGPQALSAFYNQQQQQQQQNTSLSGTPPNANLFRESQSLTDIFNHANKLSALSNVHLTDQQQQQMVLSQLYLNQISSLPFVTLYDPTAASVRAFRSNGDIGEKNKMIVVNIVILCLSINRRKKIIDFSIDCRQHHRCYCFFFSLRIVCMFIFFIEFI